MTVKKGFAQVIAAGSVALLLSSCNPGLVGAGLTGAALAAAVLTYTCYDYVSITVIDGGTGRRVCDAEVTLTYDGDVLKPSSCYYLAIREGNWKLRIAKPGYADVLTDLVVGEKDNCRPYVHSIDVTLTPLGGAPAPGSPPPIPRAPAGVPQVPSAPATPIQLAPAPSGPATAPAPVPSLPAAPAPQAAGGAPGAAVASKAERSPAPHPDAGAPAPDHQPQAADAGVPQPDAALRQ